MTGDFQFAADAVGRMQEFDGAAKRIGNHAANHAGAVARSDLSQYVWAVALLPV
jgi:hypothetical protein